MESVTVERRFAADPAPVRDAIGEVGEFMRAGGFDDVTVDRGGDDVIVEITNTVGLGKIELRLRVLDDPGSALAYEQVDGIFETMETVFTVEDHDDGTVTVAGRTEFAVDAALVGQILDATIVKRQRRSELNAQLDYLEDEVGEG